MSAFIINQEGIVDLFADRLQVNRNDLANDDLRFALAFYHAFYLPSAALIEIRANELDQLAFYQALGFTPNVASFSVATLTVTVSAPPTTVPYHLAAPFVVTQAGKQFLATTDLHIPVGQIQGTTQIVAQTQGAAGTPVNGTAQVNISVGWLRGAVILVDSITPGIDGDDRETIAAKFREFAANPESLVRAADHASWLMENGGDIVGRVIAAARTETDYGPGGWVLGPNVEGHLTVAFLLPDGGLPSAQNIVDVKAMLLEQTVPYGPDALHVVPISIQPITGSIVIKAVPSIDHEILQQSAISAVNTYLSWEGWQHGRHVYAGELWSILSQVNGVDHVQSVQLNGRYLAGGPPSPDVYELFPWELPNGGFNTSTVTVV